MHWNMRDERFYFLHRLIEEQYTQIAEFIDEIAERIRQKGDYAPKSLKEILNLATIKESKSIESGSKMLVELRKSYESLVTMVHQGIERAGHHEDLATQDTLIQLAKFLEKNIWILESHQK